MYNYFSLLDDTYCFPINCNFLCALFFLVRFKYSATSSTRISFLRIQGIADEWGSPCFLGNFSVIREQHFDASLLIPSLMLKTKSIKIPFATCRTLTLY